MFANFLNKLVQLITSLFILSVSVFLIARKSPGDPLRAFFGESIERMSFSQLENARERLGLNESLGNQYLIWIKDIFQGNLGFSFKYKQPVAEVIDSVIGNSVVLIGISYTLIIIISLLLAVFCVLNESNKIDRIVTRTGVMLNSIPEFFAGIVLIFVFSISLAILPAGGVCSIGNSSILDRIAHLILPVLSVVITHTWYCASLIRNKLSEELDKEYVFFLRANGLSDFQVIKHCLLNSMPAIVGIMLAFLPHLIAGTYLIEMIFSYPGLGLMALESAKYHDYNMIMIISLLTGSVVIFANIMGESICERFDGRLDKKEAFYVK